MHKDPVFFIKDGLCMEKQGTKTPQKLIAVNKKDGSTNSVPTWVAFEHQVLRFGATTTEQVPESRDETIRVRRVMILYYLEDGSIAIHATHEGGEGLSGGVLLRRHRIEHLDVQTLSRAGEVLIYGRSYQISSADKFTRDYLTSVNLDASNFLDITGELTRESKLPPKQTDRGSRDIALGGSNHIDKRKTMQFLENDGKVLRFYATSANDEDKRDFVILYFLADDTIEIRESFGLNTGRDELAVWFRRGKVDSQGKPVLNKQDIYEEFDMRSLRIGDRIQLIHAPFLITDADNFTRDFFRTEVGLELGTTVTGTNPVAVVNFRRLKPDFEESTKKQEIRSDQGVLRCACRDESGRKFILSFYLADEHVTLFEPPVKNSGIQGGRFLEKGSYVNSQTGLKIQPDDLVMKNRIGILGRTFVIEECDEFTVKFLNRQKNPQKVYVSEPPTQVPKHVNPISELLRTRPGFDVRLMKELSVLARGANQGTVNLMLQALRNLGHAVERSALTESIKCEPFNFYDLIHSLKRTHI
jgi:hypothetical protein